MIEPSAKPRDLTKEEQNSIRHKHPATRVPCPMCKAPNWIPTVDAPAVVPEAARPKRGDPVVDHPVTELRPRNCGSCGAPKLPRVALAYAPTFEAAPPKRGDLVS